MPAAVPVSTLIRWSDEHKKRLQFIVVLELPETASKNGITEDQWKTLQCKVRQVLRRKYS